MSKKGKTNSEVAEQIFGKQEASKLLAKKMSIDEIADDKYTKEDQKEDENIQDIVDSFFSKGKLKVKVIKAIDVSAVVIKPTKVYTTKA